MSDANPRYDPHCWYWVDESGRIWSSARSLAITPSDSDYKMWVASGGVPTLWPRDETGQQTDEALDAVLAPYGLRCSPPDPWALARAECGRRIFARASSTTQANMGLYAGVLAAIPAASRTAAQKADIAALADAAAWVDAMRARWPQIAADGLDPTDDTNWPQPSAAAVALAGRF